MEKVINYNEFLDQIKEMLEERLHGIMNLFINQ